MSRPALGIPERTSSRGSVAWVVSRGTGWRSVTFNRRQLRGRRPSSRVVWSDALAGGPRRENSSTPGAPSSRRRSAWRDWGACARAPVSMLCGRAPAPPLQRGAPFSCVRDRGARATESHRTAGTGHGRSFDVPRRCGGLLSGVRRRASEWAAAWHLCFTWNHEPPASPVSVAPASASALARPSWGDAPSVVASSADWQVDGVQRGANGHHPYWGGVARVCRGDHAGARRRPPALRRRADEVGVTGDLRENS